MGYRGSACVEVMNTLHGSVPSLRRRAKGCVPSEGMIASARDPLKSTPLLFKATLTLWAVGSVGPASGWRTTKVALPPVIVPTPTLEDPHARMDRLEQRLRMPEIERYTGIGCPCIYLSLYNTIMRAHGLDEAQMVMLFPMSLSGATQRWRELKALRQRPEESVTSFISRWREKISQVIDRPSERDQIGMIMRSLQPRFARHLMGFPHTDFGSLVQALYDIEESITRELWSESSPSDLKGKKPLGGQRLGDVGAIGSAGLRPPRRY
ncbi:hypothetical protein CK203_041207 [Vitis vinifera]|uniref:Retrotransposon gag domain-containing protein n=1 Tax=Vitis vinifera TaxID=29760 RepID=A0A438HT81_VITVI|nr:hypothetical protein CK203_041207 [Vitis vinifera]